LDQRGWLGENIPQLFRRYFVNTLFDATFVVLAIFAAALVVPEADVQVAVGTIFAVCLAIGVSTGVSVYEAERTEGEIQLRRISRAMLASMGGTEMDRRVRLRAALTALVNFLTPLLVATVTATPVVLYELGLLPDLLLASLVASALGLSIIFGAGYHLGTQTGRPPWKKGLRMTAIALLTFAFLLLLERVI
jgi:VIT1/CCC1 family predicted Fe2+/Mn2+ transporter